MTGVTVAICCHNSASRIRPTLEHLLAQAGAAPHSWEVLLVDNGSTDETIAVAKKTWTARDVPLRVVTESRLGLMHARKRAFREATFEYVTFIDDDNWVCPEWISGVEQILNAHPDVAAVGARSEAVFEIPPPSWFAGFRGCYAAGQQWPETGDVTAARGFLWGAGLTIRKAAWQQIHAQGFHSQLEGRRGSALTAGEDNEICQALRLAGWRLYQEPKLSFRHFIPAQRLNWDYLRKIITNFGASSILLFINGVIPTPKRHGTTGFPATGCIRPLRLSRRCLPDRCQRFAYCAAWGLDIQTPIMSISIVAVCKALCGYAAGIMPRSGLFRNALGR
jgi:glycosyltransferase involved in cell wall biosynthesis